MKRLTLFRKIFLCFLLTVLVSMGAHLSLTLFLREHGFFDRYRVEEARGLLRKYGPLLADVYEAEGGAELNRQFRRLRNEKGFVLLMLDGEGNPLAGMRNGFMARMMEKHGHEMNTKSWRGSPVVTDRIVSSSGGIYLATLFALPGALRPERNPMMLLGIYLLFFICIGGAVSYILARHFSRPVEKLSVASRALALGNLSSRVDVERHFGGDEIDQLAKSFNAMAGHIEKMITAQNRLLRDISHELRSPLTRANLALELLRGRANSDQGKLIDRLERESERMNVMIGSLLELERQESRFGEAQKEDISLRDLLERIVQDARFEARASGRDVKSRSIPDLTFRGNERLLISALENLIRNGLKYTAAGTAVTIDAKCEDLSDGTGRLVMTISDRGPGVSEENLRNLFLPFFREDEARDRSTGGVGLGLAIARRAIVLHGGGIEAANRPGGGLVMTVSIPIIPIGA